jgi:hypothetical protein
MLRVLSLMGMLAVMMPACGDDSDVPNPNCAFGHDETCNDDSAFSSIHGACNNDGTCTCRGGFEKNPDTGRCM